MYLLYNGIDLRICAVTAINRQSILAEDGATYLHTRWTIAVDCIYHGDSPGRTFVTAGSQGTTGRYPDRVDDSISQETRNSPVLTDAHLRFALMQPRKRLVLAFDSSLDTASAGPLEALLVCPLGSLPCDVANGPVPTRCDVVSVAGNARVFAVRYEIVACVNECNLGNESAPALLSQAWESSMGWDTNGLATRTTTMVLTFRPDFVRAKKIDLFAERFKWFQKIPQNCRRYVDDLTLGADGFTVHVVYRDVEEATTFFDVPTKATGEPVPGAKPRNITHIDLVVDRQYVQNGAAQIARQVASDLAQFAFARREKSLDRKKSKRDGGGRRDKTKGAKRPDDYNAKGA